MILYRSYKDNDLLSDDPYDIDAFSCIYMEGEEYYTYASGVRVDILLEAGEKEILENKSYFKKNIKDGITTFEKI